MQDLIDKLESATEGSRELDAHLSAALLGNGAYAAVSEFNGAWCVYRGEDRSGRARVVSSNRGDVPDVRLHYTTSLDAALTLVPEGDGWLISDKPFAEIFRPLRVLAGRPTALADRVGVFGDKEIRKSTPALALCIAALRAREQMK